MCYNTPRYIVAQTVDMAPDNNQNIKMIWTIYEISTPPM